MQRVTSQPNDSFGSIFFNQSNGLGERSFAILKTAGRGCGLDSNGTLKLNIETDSIWMGTLCAFYVVGSWVVTWSYIFHRSLEGCLEFLEICLELVSCDCNVHWEIPQTMLGTIWYPQAVQLWLYESYRLSWYMFARISAWKGTEVSSKSWAIWGVTIWNHKKKTFHTMIMNKNMELLLWSSGIARAGANIFAGILTTACRRSLSFGSLWYSFILFLLFGMSPKREDGEAPSKT